MKPITEYQSERHARILLQGPPGGGKSCVGMQFPKVGVIDFDVNMRGPLDWLKSKNLPLPVAFSTIDRDDDGKEVPFPMRYTRLDGELQKMQADPNIETIFLDSATNMIDVLVAETLRKQNKSAMSKQEWGFFFTYSKQLMATLTQMRKHIVISAHEKVNKKEDGSIVLPYKVAWPGQFGMIIGAFFSDVWRCEFKVIPKGMTNEYKQIIRTMPDYQYELKNSLGLPAEFEFSWPEIERRLGGAR